jgi:hypothetical protein
MPSSRRGARQTSNDSAVAQNRLSLATTFRENEQLLLGTWLVADLGSQRRTKEHSLEGSVTED